jgi:predicted nuclease of predicted toxin-antitoxin system
MRFVIDENLPFSFVHLLKKSKLDVLDVAASPLRGLSDDRIWTVAA